MRLSNFDSNVALQPIGDLVIAPLRGPVTKDLIGALSGTLLDHLHHTGAQGVILDLSGVNLLDDHDLHDLRKVVQSAGLMGARVVMAGMRPGVAIGLTMLDVEDDWIHSARTVDAAMEVLA